MAICTPTVACQQERLNSQFCTEPQGDAYLGCSSRPPIIRYQYILPHLSHFFSFPPPPVQGRFEPYPCPEGSYCPNATAVLPCPKGHFCPVATATPLDCGWGLCPGEKNIRPLFFFPIVIALLFDLAILCCIWLPKRNASVRIVCHSGAHHSRESASTTSNETCTTLTSRVLSPSLARRPYTATWQTQRCSAP